MERNWNELGITWSAEEVSEQTGPHATSRRVIGTAQILIVVDLEKFRAHNVNAESVVLGSMDGTSVRVKSQSVGRACLKAGIRDADTMRERVYASIMGMRQRLAPTVVEKIVNKMIHALPDGSTYDGDDEMEYRQLYTLALVEAGVAAAVAADIAKSVAFTK